MPRPSCCHSRASVKWVHDVRSRGAAMAMEEIQDFDWYRETGKICYNDTIAGTHWCGNEEECYGKGMVLPLVNESTWDWRVRAFLYGFGLLYRWIITQPISNSGMPSSKALNHLPDLPKNEFVCVL